MASLRTWLVGLALVATLPIAALVATLLADDLREREQRIQAVLHAEAALLARSVQRELAATADALAVLAQAHALAGAEPGALQSELARRRLQLRANWAGVLLLAADGQVLFDGAATRVSSFDALATPAAQRALAEAQPLVLWVPPRTLVALPVAGDGQRRWLAAALDAALWQQLLAGALRGSDRLRGLFDRDGRTVALVSAGAGPTIGELPAGLLDALRAQSVGVARAALPVAAEPLLLAWEPVPLGDWGIAVGAPAAPLEAEQRGAIARAAGIAAACVLLGVALALLIARRVTRPLRRLAEHGAAQALESIPVRELALLRDALLVAQAQDEVARERLRKKADEFETLFASTPIGLAFALDPQAQQVLHNPAMTALAGPPPGRDGVPGLQVMHRGQPLPLAQQPLQRAAAQGETVTAMELQLLRDGEAAPRTVIAHAVPLRDQHGRPRGAIAALVDISERKQVEARLLSTDERLRQNQHLIDLAQEAGQVGFFHYQFGPDTLSWTPGQAKLFGVELPQSESLAAWVQRIDPDDRVRVQAQLRELLAARRERDALEFRVRRDDDERWLSSRILVSYADDGEPKRMIGVTVDITDSKRVEAERAALVEREQLARREAEAANRAKDEFLAMLGHELRNPLSAISSAVEVLHRAEAGSELAGNARSIIARQTRHLAHLMEDLLDVARVISGKVVLARAPLDLAALARRCAATLDVTGATREHQLALALDEEVWVDGDTTRLDQVVNNLLTNALKYTPAGGRIEVAVTRDGADALLSVRDSGVGIPPALLPRVFDLFVQGERTLDRRAGGLGIGLTLVRRLVELHGGRIAAESSPAGSVFSVRLPAIEPPAARARPAQRVPESRRRRVAVVEDNEDAREALRALLELDGHTVSTAGDGPAGLQSVLQARPDVAVIDIGLPGLTGFELARRCRAAGYAGRMIALSGYGQERDIKQALASGFDAHLVKPVDAERLRRLLIDDD